MKKQSRCFSYEKSIVANALYDTIEALGLHCESSNSTCCALIVSQSDRKGKMRIMLDSDGVADNTRVYILPYDDQRIFTIWSKVILDELSAAIRKAQHIESRGR